MVVDKLAGSMSWYNTVLKTFSLSPKDGFQSVYGITRYRICVCVYIYININIKSDNAKVIEAVGKLEFNAVLGGMSNGPTPLESSLTILTKM